MLFPLIDKSMIRHFLNILFSILPPSRLFLFRRICLKFAQVEIGKNVLVCGRGWIYGRGCLHIGSNTWLSPGVIVYTHLNAPIKIGSNCDIGPGVEFITGGHFIGVSSRRAGEGTAKTIVVNDGCWIGAGARIFGGVSIGKGAVVAAGSVVIHNVPENVLVAGVPAVVKKKLP
jgi:maltose O-acetyltransferase